MSSTALASISPAVAASDTTTKKKANGGKIFIKLPEELVSNIACKLGSDDLFALRLTCRDLEARSLHEFATEYFAHKCFIFTTESLKVFVNIAKSEKLRHYLQRVYILVARATERQLKCCQRGGCQWNPTVREHEAFLYYKNDQERLQEKGSDLEFLSEAFSHLTRLDQLLVVDDPQPLPASVKVHGIRKFGRSTGITPFYRPLDKTFVDEYYPWMTHVFRTVMLAVAKSGINTITKLHTHLGSHGLSPATDLKFKSITLEQLAKAFGNLTDLNLCFRSHSLRSGKKDSNEDFNAAARSLKSFTRLLHNVSRLSLAADVSPWSGPLVKTLTSSMDLGKVTRFQLDGLMINMNTLAAIVCQLKSAHVINLMLVELEKGSWVPILKALERLPSLNHLHLQYLQAAGQKCFFLEKPDVDEDLNEPPWLDPLVDDTTDGGDGEDENDEWSDDDGDGNSLPDLLDEGETAVPEDAPQEVVDAPLLPRRGKKSEQLPQHKSTKKAPTACPGHTGKNHRAPEAKTGERGYYICVQNDEIREQLPIFAKEYNLGGSVLGGDDFDFAAFLSNIPPMTQGAGGAVGGMFTIPVPMPGPPPPMPAAAAHAAGPPPNIPPALSTFGGILSLLGGTMPAPPPALGATVAATNTGPSDTTSAPTTTATPNASAFGQQDAHEEGWWENDDLVGGNTLDDVD